MADSLRQVIDVMVSREVKEDGKTLPETFLAACYRFDQDRVSFGPNELRIIELFGLQSLGDISWRAKLLSAVTNPEKDRSLLHDLIWDTNRSIVNLNTVVPQIFALLAQDRYESGATESSKEASSRRDNSNLGFLRLILPEAEGHPSAPSRISQAVDAISQFYEIAAAVIKQPWSDIVIVSCDSGSNKIFDFKGLGSVIEQVKELVLGVWDRIVMYRKDDYPQRIEIIRDTLPVMATIASMEETAQLSAQEAFQLKAALLRAIGGFVQSGSIIPEITNTYHLEPERLIQSQRMLLLAPPAHTAAASTVTEKVAKPTRAKTSTHSRRRANKRKAITKLSE